MNLIIIGGGNSISYYQPYFWEDIIGKQTMSINYAYKFMLESPTYQISIDTKFWKTNKEDMNNLEKKGTILINRNREYVTTKKFHREGNLYSGSRTLSGVFALSYVTRKMYYEKIFLFGYDFGIIDGQTHFYNNIKHSGLGKARAYHDPNGQILEAVKDFDNFKEYPIYVIGKSHIESFPKISYEEFKCQI